MTVKNRFLMVFKPLALAVALATASSAQGAETNKGNAIQTP
ncbi:MAG: hypothetical protein PHG00_18050 [Methylococcales bacterium]|nr:hypothetical protein [Methylococcales bacterium]